MRKFQQKLLKILISQIGKIGQKERRIYNNKQEHKLLITQILFL